MKEMYHCSGLGNGYHFPEIKKIPVEREDAKYVWVDSVKLFKRSEYSSFFSSWLEAKGYLIKKQEDHIAELKAQLKYAELALEEINKLEENNYGKC